MYSYDTLSRPLKTATTIGSLAPREFSYSYDQYSRPEELKYPSGFGIKNQYNHLGYLNRVVSPTSNNEYWAATAVGTLGNITEEKLGNGVITQRGFNPISGFLVSITTKKATKTLQDVHYTYDSIGNVYSRKNYAGDNDLTEAFIYDNLNRLTKATTLQMGSYPGWLVSGFVRRVLKGLVHVTCFVMPLRLKCLKMKQTSASYRRNLVTQAL